MLKSLLFIPDISGFTKFIQNTEAEHSQHVIAELLEVLIASNTQQLKLAEIEGDALFFYKENQVLSQEMLLAQIETMHTAFYSHLKLLEKNRICPCQACSSAINLELKIIIHSGFLQFIEVQNNRKPFGKVVIEAHRLLKNTIASDNYVLISKTLAEDIKMPLNYSSNLYRFNEGEDNYDDEKIEYLYSEIPIEKLKLKPFQEGETVAIDKAPNLIFEKKFPISSNELLEMITNYKNRYLWAIGVDEINYNENEVTRLGSEHICVISNKHLNFKVVAKNTLPSNNELVYGEVTKSPPLMDKLYQFYTISPISKTESKLQLEIFWEAKSIFKKLLLFLFVKRVFKKQINKALHNLHTLVQNKNSLIV